MFALIVKKLGYSTLQFKTPLCKAFFFRILSYGRIMGHAYKSNGQKNEYCTNTVSHFL